MSIPQPRIPADNHPTRVLRAVPAHTPKRAPVRVTTRGKVCLWAMWIILSYLIAPFAEFWWTKF